jgi:BirA family biotin operon repressor/biotin-[acetyl-CoA-carboxylase] ligase
MDKLSLVNPFGAPVYYLETLSSTMDVSRELAEAGEGHGTVIAAGFQEAGRGSRGRSWLGDRGRNLFFTILLRYPGFSAVPRGITLRAGLALSLAIEDFAPALAGSLRVKWPNDVMITSPHDGAAKKTAGILSEGDGKRVFIGIGVNVDQGEFPGEYRSRATSIALALSALKGNPRDLSAGEGAFLAEGRFRLLEHTLARLFEELSFPGGGGEPESWRNRLEERLYMKGRPVRFFPRSGPDPADAPGRLSSGNVRGAPPVPGEPVEGHVEGIGANGELLILPEGSREPRAFVSGELDVYT